MHAHFCAATFSSVLVAQAQDNATSSNAPAQAQPAATTPVLIMDRPGERRSIATKAHQDLYAGDYDSLESTHQQMLAGDERFPDGTGKLGTFYGAVKVPWEKEEAHWVELFQKIAARRVAKPDSVLAAVTCGYVLTGYAWQARGTGYADTITPDGGKLFAYRLDQAHKVLDDTYAAHHGKDILPGWYGAMQVVALGQGWSHADYDKMFDEAVATYPGHEDFYLSKTLFLKPKWYGTEGKWQAFAEACRIKYGPELYARICWPGTNDYGYDIFFEQSHIPWPMMREGFEAIEKKWATSLWDINGFCRYACAARDKPTAARLFARIGTNYVPVIWKDFQTFDAARQWAQSP